MLLYTSSILTTLVYLPTIYITPQEYRRLVQYYLSFCHSACAVSLYLSDFALQNYITPLTPKYEIIIGLHLGYFFSDTLYNYYIKDWTFVIHHVISIYYLYLNYCSQTFGMMQRAMFVAELSALAINLRTIIVKHKQKKYKSLEIITFISYFVLRSIIPPFYIIDYIRNYGFHEKQMLTIASLFWGFSTYWGKQLYLSIK